MKLYIVAGEVSGDLHAANLMKAIYEQQAEISFKGVGGDKMIAQGLDCTIHIRELNVMGLTEVLKNIYRVRRILQQVKRDILSSKPDAIVLVDYPGFNIQLARFARRHKIKSIYYISPKVWAWHSSRAKTLRDNVDYMLSILPFETAFYKKYHYDAHYIGNPVVDAITSHSLDRAVVEKLIKADKPVIALLPGSRHQEIAQCLPEMIRVSKAFPDYHFVIAGLESTLQQIQTINTEHLEVLCTKTYELLSVSRAAFVTSGTATLETALFKVPQVCCYKTSALTYIAAKQLIRIPYISLVNLIADKLIIKELIQHKFTEKNLMQELALLVNNGTYREEMLNNYDELIQILGGPGASQRAAIALLGFLKSSSC